MKSEYMRRTINGSTVNVISKFKCQQVPG